MSDITEMKKLLIDYLYGMVAQDSRSMKELEKEFNLSEAQLERLVRKFLDRWLASPDMVAMLCEMLGVYPAGSREERGHGHYIG